MTSASKLRSKRNEIIERWKFRVDRELPKFGDGTTSYLVNISSFFDQLIDSLESNSSLEFSVTASLNPIHSGDHLNRFIREISIFRQELSRALKSDSAADEKDWITVLNTLDQSIESMAMQSDSEEEKQEQHLEAWLDLSLKSAGIGAYILYPESADEEIIRTDAYNKIFELDPSSRWTRKDWFKIVFPDDLPLIQQRIESFRPQSSERYFSEYRILRKEGGIRWINSWGKVLSGSPGKGVCFAGVLRDVTEQKLLEESRAQFVATLSHDLRNPLASAQANAEVILKYPAKVADTKKLLKKISANIQRADGMIQDLLDTTRMRTGRKLELVWQGCDLRDVVEDVLEDMSLIYGDRFKLSIDGEFKGSWPCSGIRRVLENLIGNAVKYGLPSLPVTVELKRVLGLVNLSVKNQGNPIPHELTTELFEPFRRAKLSGTQSQRGWGLGLAMVHGVSQALDGRVDVESSPGAGTIFRLSFPERKAEAAA
jgi:PAS domain-containing protein